MADDVEMPKLRSALSRTQIGSATSAQLNRFTTNEGQYDVAAMASEKARERKTALIVIVAMAVFLCLLIVALFGVSFAAAQFAKDWNLANSAIFVNKADASPMGMQGALRETPFPVFSAATSARELVGIDQFVLQIDAETLQDFRVVEFRRSSAGIQFVSAAGGLLFYPFSGATLELSASGSPPLQLPLAALVSSYSKSVESRLVSRTTTSSSSAPVKFSTNFSTPDSLPFFTFAGSQIFFVGRSLFSTGVVPPNAPLPTARAILPVSLTDSSNRFSIGLWCYAETKASAGDFFFTLQPHIDPVYSWTSSYSIGLRLDSSGGLRAAIATDLSRSNFASVITPSFSRNSWHKVLVEGNANGDAKFCVQLDDGARTCAGWSMFLAQHTELFFLTGPTKPLDGRLGSFIAASGANASSLARAFLSDSANTPDLTPLNVSCMLASEDFVNLASNVTLVSGDGDLLVDSLRLNDALATKAQLFHSFTGFTVTLWLSRDDLTSNGTLPILAMQSGGSATASLSQASLSVLLNSATGNVFASFKGQSSVTIVPEVTTRVNETNKFFFVAVSGGDEGLCIRTAAGSQCYPSLPYNWDGSWRAVDTLYFGRIDGLANPGKFRGRIDSLKLFRCQLPASEISLLAAARPEGLTWAEDFRLPAENSKLTLIDGATYDSNTLFPFTGRAQLPFGFAPTILPASSDIYVGFWLYTQNSTRTNQAVMNVYNASSASDPPASGYLPRLVVIYREPTQLWSRTFKASGYVVDTPRIAISPNSWYMVVMQYLRSQSKICMVVTPLNGVATTNCTSGWDGTFKPFNSISFGQLGQLDGRYAAMAASSGLDGVTPYLARRIPPAIVAQSAPASSGICQDFGVGKYCAFSGSNLMSGLQSISSSSAGGNSSSSAGDWLSFGPIKPYLDDVVSYVPTIYTVVAFGADPRPASFISPILTQFVAYEFDDLAACSPYDTGVRPGVTLLGQITFPCNGTSAFCSAVNTVLAPLAGGALDVFFHAGWDYSLATLNGFPDLAIGAQVAIRYSNSNNPLDFIIFKLRDFTFWLDAKVATGTPLSPSAKESVFVGLSIQDMRVGAPLFGLQNVVFGGCVTYGFEVALGKKIGTAEFAVGARLSMVGTWYPTFVSHKRFAISNVTLAATAKLFPGGFQELGGTLNGRFALCHRDLVTCVNGFSDSQVGVALSSGNLHVNMNVTNVTLGTLLSVLTDCKEVSSVLPAPIRNLGFDLLSVFLVPSPSAANQTSGTFVDTGYIGGITIVAPFPQFLAPGSSSSGNSMVLTINASSGVQCQTDNGGSTASCTFTAGFEFGAILNKPLNLGIPGTVAITVAHPLNSNLGPSWVGSSNAAATFSTALSGSVSAYTLSSLDFSSTIAGNLKGTIFGYELYVEVLASLFTVPTDNADPDLPSLLTTEVHMTFASGLCFNFNDFAEFAMDALLIREADSSLNAGASFASTTTRAVVQVRTNSLSQLSDYIGDKLTCKTWAKLKAAVQSTCNFVSNLFNNVLEGIPLKTFDKLATCTCPGAGTLYVGAGVCAPNLGKAYPCPCHTSGYTRLDGNTCFLSRIRAPKFATFSKKCAKRTKVLGRRICVWYTVEASCPSGYFFLSGLCVDARPPFISDTADCSCKSGTARDSTTGWCLPSFQASAATCTCPQGSPVAGMCFKDVNASPLSCPTDATTSSLSGLRSVFSSLSNTVGPVCQEVCKLPGVLDKLKSATKLFCDQSNRNCTVECEECDACTRVCQVIGAVTGDSIVSAIDFLQSLNRDCSSDPTFPSKKRDVYLPPPPPPVAKKDLDTRYVVCTKSANTSLDWDTIQTSFGEAANDSYCDGKVFDLIDMTFLGEAHLLFGQSAVGFSLRFCLAGKSDIVSFQFSANPASVVEDFVESQWAKLWKRFLGIADDAIDATEAVVNTAVDMFSNPGKICGNFCGPGWCAGTSIDNDVCVSSGLWANTTAASGVCADSCCRAHDKCCSGDRTQCNRVLVQCLEQSCSSNIYKLGTCENFVHSGMRALESMCCGSTC